jgi:hypothetical protein
MVLGIKTFSIMVFTMTLSIKHQVFVLSVILMTFSIIVLTDTFSIKHQVFVLRVMTFSIMVLTAALSIKQHVSMCRVSFVIVILDVIVMTFNIRGLMVTFYIKHKSVVLSIIWNGYAECRCTDIQHNGLA